MDYLRFTIYLPAWRFLGACACRLERLPAAVLPAALPAVSLPDYTQVSGVGWRVEFCCRYHIYGTSYMPACYAS